MATIIDRYKLIIETAGANGGISQLTGLLRGMGPLVAGAFVATAVVQFGQQVIEVGKRFETMRNQLRLVTNSTQELNSVFNSLQQVSNRTGAGLDETVELYQKLDLATGSLGKSTDEILLITENFQKALALSGADANTASAAIRQFGQAMASGTVRGDEFTSIVEALGPALAIVARETGYTIGDLRNLSQAGGLTSEVFGDMIQKTQALNTAFGSLSLTTEQVETNLGKTFDEILNKVDEGLGITATYRDFIAGVNRNLADLFNTSQSLEALTLDDITDRVEANSLRIDEALVELRGRLSELNIFEVFRGEGSEIENLIAQLEALREARMAEQAASEEDKARIDALIAPYTALEERIAAVSDAYNQNLPQVEKLRQEYDQTRELLTQLEALRDTEIGQYTQLEGSIETTRGRMAQLEEQMLRLQAPTEATAESIRRFYEATITDAQESVVNLELVQGAINLLNEAFERGDISSEIFTEALQNLQGQLGDTADKTKELNREVEDFFASAAERVARQRDELELAGLSGLERDQARIRQEEERSLAAVEARLKAQGYTTAEIENQLGELRRVSEETIRNRQETERLTQTTARETETRQKAAEEAAKRAQRTFANGWKNAYEDYANSARDAFSTAESLFAKTTQGMEDLLVGFAKTGKFEWKSFVQDITETLLRSQIKGLIADIFGGGNSSSTGSGFASGAGGTVNSIGGQISDLLGGFGGFGGDTGGGGGFGGMADGTYNNPFYVVPVGGGLGGGAGTGFSPVGFNTPTNLGFRAPQEDYLAEMLTGGISSAFTPFESLVKRRFAGGFANGGFIPAGAYGMVGERGPEFVGGPAQVSPMGNQTVNYNINAVDARSFKELVAADPGFIHAVASVGGQQIPRRRR